MWRPVTALIARELLRTARQRSRLLSALVRPLIWLLVIGGGVETMVGRGGPDGYRAFLAPGLIAMTLLFGAMLAALALVHDKESGVLRLLLMAPFHHAWIVVARTLGAALVAIAQALLLLALLAAFGYVHADWSFALLAAGLVATALAAASLGMLVAVWTRSLDNFAVMMNFVIFPVFFLSGALYPIQGLPPWLRAAATLNPFSYGVDLLKHAAGAGRTDFVPDFPVAVDLAVLLGFVVVATALACLRFSAPSTIGALARLVGGGRAR
jgi:ABC-2 type transport system permease protein